MFVASWNINSLRKRQDAVALYMKNHRPGILGLQEIKCPTELAPVFGKEFSSIIHGQKAYNGIAAFIRDGFQGDRQISRGWDTEKARYLSFMAFNVRTHIIYAPNGKNKKDPAFLEKLSWYEKLVSHLELEMLYYKNEDHILMGDFNVTLTPMDSSFEDSDTLFHSREERQALASCLNLGFYDTLNPKNPMFSWWDYRQNSFKRNLGLRIDMIWVTKGLFSRLEVAGIHKEERAKELPSDHAPVYAIFK